MTDEQHFDNDFDEACHRIVSAATTALLLHRDRLPDGVVQALKAIADDARFLYQFGQDAERMLNDDIDPGDEQ